MNEERSRSLKAIGKVVLKIFLVCLVITAVLYAVLAVMAQKKEKTALEEWNKAGYSLDERYKSLKAIKENDCAKGLSDLAARMGISSSTNPVDTKADYISVFDYMTDQLQKERRDLTRPSTPIEDTIHAARPGIDELCALLDKATPVWAYDTSIYSTHYPDYLAIISFQRLLCVDGLLSEIEGDTERSKRNIRYSLKILYSVDQNHGLIASIIKIACYKMILGSARVMASLPDDIASEIAAIDPVKIMKEGYFQEAVNSWKFLSDPRVLYGKEGGIKGNIVSRMLFGNYWRLCVADFLVYYLQVFKSLEDSNPCQVVVDENQQKIINSIPKWNLVGQIAMPNLRDSWARSNRAALEKELTLVILKLRAEKTKSGAYPDSIELPQSPCPKTEWKYSKNGDNFSVYFDGEFKSSFKDPKKGLPLSLKWEE